MLTLAQKGGGGVWQMLIFADDGEVVVWKMLTALTTML